MFKDAEVARKMSEANELGMDPDSYSTGDLEEIEKIHEVYNSEESRLIDGMASAMLDLLELGECAPAKASDARDFACMIDDLSAAKTAEEFDETVACYGMLGSHPAVQEYVAYKKARMSA